MDQAQILMRCLGENEVCSFALSYTNKDDKFSQAEGVLPQDLEPIPIYNCGGPSALAALAKLRSGTMSPNLLP